MTTFKITFTQCVYETCELIAQGESIDEIKDKFLAGELYGDGYTVIESEPYETLDKITIDEVDTQ